MLYDGWRQGTRINNVRFADNSTTIEVELNRDWKDIHGHGGWKRRPGSNTKV